MKIVFSRHNSIVGFFIRLGTLSRWDHVDIMLDDGSLIGSTGHHGVEHVSFSYRKSQIACYKIDKIELKDESAAIDFAKAQIGKKYDFGAVWAFVLPFRKWDSPDKWFCSELVAAAAVAGGEPMIRKKVNRITPNMLDLCPYLEPVVSPIAVD